MAAKYSLLCTVFVKASIIQDPSVIDTSNLVPIFQTPQETWRTTKKSKVKVTFRSWAQIRSVRRLTKNYDRDKFTHAQSWSFAADYNQNSAWCVTPQLE